MNNLKTNKTELKEKKNNLLLPKNIKDAKWGHDVISYRMKQLMIVPELQRLSHMHNLSKYLKSGSGIAPYPSDACRLNRISSQHFIYSRGGNKPTPYQHWLRDKDSCVSSLIQPHEMYILVLYIILDYTKG